MTALTEIEAIYIKATYTTVPQEAALEFLSLDIASERNYGRELAYEVERCTCVTGTQGLSCEECAPGYFKSLNYPGTCEPCNCHGHSEICDQKSGACLDCRDYTTGTNCERCLPGYYGNATDGTQYDCRADPGPPDNICDRCDPRGTDLARCEYARNCICKKNVEGVYCNQCREGTFGLSAANPDGCAECFCSGTGASCSELAYFKQQIPLPILDESHGFLLTDREGSPTGDESRYKVNPFETKLEYEFDDERTYYWSLPDQILGNRILSYGGNLTITQDSVGRGNFVPDQDVIIKGNGLTLFWQRNSYNDGVSVNTLLLILDPN